MTAQVDEVSSSAQTLSELARTLQQAVSQFKLSTNGDRELATAGSQSNPIVAGRGGATAGEQAQAEQGALVASPPENNGRQFDELPVAGAD